MSRPAPTTEIAPGVHQPCLGYGTGQISPSTTERAVRAALEEGYRHVDTAQMYRNEAQVGAALRCSGIDRSELFLTSKLDNHVHRRRDALAAFEGTLRATGLDYVDLFLVHWPMAELCDVAETWAALELVHASGRARAIGVSNFGPEHLRRVLATGSVPPAVNQIELHPYRTRRAMRRLHAELGIVTQAWSPLGEGAVLGDAVIGAIAAAHGRTPAQVVLRWHLQVGTVVFPRTTSRAHQRENLAATDFTLTDAEVAAVCSLDREPSSLTPP